MKIRIKNAYAITIPALILLVGAAVWIMAVRVKSESCGADYQWLNPALGCSSKPVISKAVYRVFRDKLTLQIDAWKKEGRVEEVAVFFRDLENGPTFGINDHEKFIPASLLKVPVMFTYFKLAEEDPSILENKLEYKTALSELLPPQTGASEHKLELGRTYKVDNLIFRMIAYSDNGANLLLLEHLKRLSPDRDLLTETFTELGMINLKGDIEAEALSAKTYASFFRLMYNSSYLSKEFSEKGLKYLSQSDYKQGIRGGIPGNISVANKFGERQISEDRVQLHDCGIIYYPENPYLLCVMTKGNDFEELSDTIRSVSGAVWEEISSRKL